MSSFAFFRGDFANLPNVSRETLECFDRWKALLEQWNSKINLVSPAAMTDFWGRHALDSWQVWEHMPDKTDQCLDLGSGAGFPGLAVAIGLKTLEGRSGQVTLVESAGKKANFLRTVIRELQLPAKVHADRAEKLAPQPYDVITARAFAPLPRLLNYAEPFWGQGTCAVLLKGQAYEGEIKDAQQDWSFETSTAPSLSDNGEGGVVLSVRGLKALTS